MKARVAMTFVDAMVQSVVRRATDAGRRTAASVKAWSRPVKAGARLGVARDLVRSRRQLIADNALLRQQLVVLERSVERPRFR